MDNAESTAAIVDEVGATGAVDRRLDVYAPVRFGNGPIRGVAEVVLSYDETGAAVSAATHTILLVVLGGLVVLWLLLFRTVHSTLLQLALQVGPSTRVRVTCGLILPTASRLFALPVPHAATTIAGVGNLLQDATACRTARSQRCISSAARSRGIVG